MQIRDTGDTLDARTTYRTHVAFPNAHARTRLKGLGAKVLWESAAEALVLADEEQLEVLARLRFQPRQSDSLAELVRLSGLTLHRGLSLSQVALLSSVDDDGDGLTDTEEAWWGTDPLCSDSDGDGTTDKAEVDALREWIGNRRAGPPASGKPFQGWPPQTDSVCDVNRHFPVPDDDRDGVPDLAERWMLGLNMNRESTDRDKFDDGQELFGTTKWAWGALPRAEDTGIIFAEMPGWVKAPGNHPLVAAFPVPEVDVVQSSLHVEAVTTVTTDHTIGEGTERSYSTAKTEGTSTSVANSRTWNEWEESSMTSPLYGSHQLDVQLSRRSGKPSTQANLSPLSLLST